MFGRSTSESVCFETDAHFYWNITNAWTIDSVSCQAVNALDNLPAFRPYVASWNNVEHRKVYVCLNFAIYIFYCIWPAPKLFILLCSYRAMYESAEPLNVPLPIDIKVIIYLYIEHLFSLDIACPWFILYQVIKLCLVACLFSSLFFV